MFLDACGGSGDPGLRTVPDPGKLHAQSAVPRKQVPYQGLRLLSNCDDRQSNRPGQLEKPLQNGALPGVYRAAPPGPGSAGHDTLTITISRRKGDWRNSYSGKCVGYFFVEAAFLALDLFDAAREVQIQSGLFRDFPGLFKLLVIGRALHPESALRTYRSAANYLFPFIDPYDPATGQGVSAEQVYEALDAIADSKTRFLTRMSAGVEHLFGPGTGGSSCDRVNFYLGAVLEKTQTGDDDANARGHNRAVRISAWMKNRRNAATQVGLMTDSSGMPLTYRICHGTGSTPRTLLSTLCECREAVHAGRIVVICDCETRGVPDRGQLIREGHGYILAQRLSKSYTDQEAWLAEPEGFTETVDEHGTVTARSREYVMDQVFELYEKGPGSGVKGGRKSGNAAEGYGDAEDRGEPVDRFTAREKVILYWSKAFCGGDRISNSSALRKLRKIEKLPPEKLDPTDPFVRQFLKAVPGEQGEAAVETDAAPGAGHAPSAAPAYVLDRDKIAGFRNSMGFCLVRTSELDLTAEDVMDRLRGLVRMEDCFQIDRSDPEMRPEYIRTDRYLDAHLLIGSAALAVTRSVQRRILAMQDPPVQADRWEECLATGALQKSLLNFCASRTGDYYQTSRPDDTVALIHRACGVEMPLAWMTPSELHAWHKSIVDAAARPLRNGRLYRNRRQAHGR